MNSIYFNINYRENRIIIIIIPDNLLVRLFEFIIVFQTLQMHRRLQKDVYPLVPCHNTQISDFLTEQYFNSSIFAADRTGAEYSFRIQGLILYRIKFACSIFSAQIITIAFSFVVINLLPIIIITYMYNCVYV